MRNKNPNNKNANMQMKKTNDLDFRGKTVVCMASMIKKCCVFLPSPARSRAPALSVENQTINRTW
jgi:hypothetical protein